MTNSRLINVYFDREINEGCYVAVYDDGSTWVIAGQRLEGEDFEEFLHDVSKYIDSIEFEKSIILKKYKSEVKKLEEINHKMYIELERLQRLENELKSQKQGE
ncbi:hypothetical protein [uncultured Methanobrevibacter sp.]|uniref:hypothetical protein n=1 Tax=uncultured Methanobrevibacter sp. TaxID=253161 RepID=UPI0025DA0D3E|nr:hypothetical protein [uncultured Methanobrevibacter sp.]